MATFAADRHAWAIAYAWVAGAMVLANVAFSSFLNLNSAFQVVLSAGSLIMAGVGIAAAYGKLMKLPNGALIGILFMSESMVILALLADLAFDDLNLNVGE